MEQDRRPRKRSRKKALTSALAILLAISFVVQQMGSVAISGMSYEGAGQSAASYLTDTTGYLDGNVVQRAAGTMKGMIRAPSSLEAHYEQAGVYIAKADYSGALEHIEACIEMDQGSDELRADLWMKKGCLLALLEKNDEALEALDHALKYDDQLDDAYLIRAQIYIQKEETELAYNNLEIYLERNPQDTEVQSVMAELNLLNGQYEEAVRYYSLLIEEAGEDGPDKELYYKRAGCYLLLEQVEAAEADVNSYLSMLEEPTTDAVFMAGLCRILQEDYEGALARFEETLELGYEDPELCQEQMVQCYFFMEDEEKTIAVGEEAVLQADKLTAPDVVYRQIGLSEMYIGEAEEAISSFTEAISRSDMTQDYYYRGICRMALAQYEEAISDFTKSIEGEVMIQSGYYNRAICYLELDNIDEAIDDLQNTLEFGEDESLKNSAQQLLETLNNVKEV